MDTAWCIVDDIFFVLAAANVENPNVDITTTVKRMKHRPMLRGFEIACGAALV